MTADTLSTLVARAKGRKQKFNQTQSELAKIIAQGTTLPAYVCIAAANYTTVGGAASEAITIPGLLATDIVNVTLKTAGATPRTIASAACTANTLTVVFSGNPSTDHVIGYQIVRAVG